MLILGSLLVAAVVGALVFSGIHSNFLVRFVFCFGALILGGIGVLYMMARYT